MWGCWSLPGSIGNNCQDIERCFATEGDSEISQRVRKAARRVQGNLAWSAGDEAAHHEFGEERERQAMRHMKDADNWTWVTWWDVEMAISKWR
jgi:hypothetical protein